VLSRNWDKGQQWTVGHEYQTNQENLLKLVQGLIARCTQQIFLCAVQINEYGSEQRGPLMQALQTLQKRMLASNGGNDV
jgi:tRNA A37 methylthiotransferase MiaB